MDARQCWCHWIFKFSREFRNLDFCIKFSELYNTI
jgi:hypothetical protein